MHPTAEFLLALGAIFLLGLAADYLGRHTFLPRVTVLLALGILIGNHGLDMIPQTLVQRFDLIADMALLMIGFLLGGRLTLRSLRRMGTPLLSISLSAALGASLLVAGALHLAGMPTDIAILLGCIAAATAPAATTDTVLEADSRSPFAQLLLAVVAIDDLWALLLFSLGLALVSLLNGGDTYGALLHAGYEVGGAVVLGLAIGLPAAYLTGRLKPGQPILTEALGLVFACGGAALWLDVSYLIAAIVMGSVIANLARHHDYPFHEIENIEWPFMVIFFMLAGASLEIAALATLGLFGLVYLLARSLGKIAGAGLGALLSSAGKPVSCWMGLALLPQAGVAIGMGLIAASRFPDYRQTILSLVIGTTVVFELVGPVLTRVALRRTEHCRH